MKTIERIKNNLNPDLSIRGILLTMYDKRNKLSGEVERKHEIILKKSISNSNTRNVRLSEAPSHGMPVLFYDKSCPGSKSYFSFTDEFVNQEKLLEVQHDKYNKIKGLGRGLSSLIGDTNSTPKSNKVSISSIVRNKFQPRKSFNKEQMDELTNSIREGHYSANYRKKTSDKFEIIAGEEDGRQHKMLGYMRCHR